MFEGISAAKGIVKSYFDAFKGVPDAPRMVFARHGLGTIAVDGAIEFVGPAPLEKLIAATNELFALVGPQKAFEIGLHVVANAVHPPGANEIISAFHVFDCGYHLNHVKDGVPMFDPQTGTMVEGIGHYKCVTVSKHRLIVEVDTPYYCDFDRGIMQGWARLFDRTALVTHLEPGVCRKKRSRACKYEVSWK